MTFNICGTLTFLLFLPEPAQVKHGWQQVVSGFTSTSKMKMWTDRMKRDGHAKVVY